MPNKNIDARVFCPFYIKEGKKSITCEGLIGTSVVSFFDTEKKKRAHEECFCVDKSSANCPLHEALWQKWEKIEKSLRS